MMKNKPLSQGTLIRFKDEMIKEYSRVIKQNQIFYVVLKSEERYDSKGYFYELYPSPWKDGNPCKIDLFPYEYDVVYKARKGNKKE